MLFVYQVYVKKHNELREAYDVEKKEFYDSLTEEEKEDLHVGKKDSKKAVCE